VRSEVITSNSKIVGIAGGDASPASDPTVIVSKLVSNTNNLNKDNKQLSLTGNRTSPQPPEKLPTDYSAVVTYNRSKSPRLNDNQLKARDSRSEIAEKKFAMRWYPSAYCDSQKIAIINVRNSKVESMTTKPSHCKSWACPVCAPYNARRVRRLIEQVVLLNNLEYFYTLTLSPGKIPKEYRKNTHKYMTLLFNKLILYLKRQCKITTPFKYVWVMEYQKNGNAHMHGMWNQFVDVKILRKIWTSIGGGRMMRLEKAKNLLITARYISKYLSKALYSDYSNFYYFQKRYAISLNCVRPKIVTISSSESWGGWVYQTYPLVRDYLSTLIDPDDKEPSLSFNFYEPSKDFVKKIDPLKKET
jgi:hypothetical protein